MSRFLIIYANDDGETRILLKDEEEAVQWLIDSKPDAIITDPPDPDPNNWPEGTVLMRAVIRTGLREKA